MENIIVLYGGKSAEHDISIITAMQVLKNIDREKYNVLPIYITKDNNFITFKNADKIDAYTKQIKKFKKVCFDLPHSQIKINRKTMRVDCAINCCHGFYGEDGMLASILEFCDIAHTGTSTLASAITMDKIVMKDIFKSNDIACVDYVYITKKDAYKNKNYIDEICTKLDFPLIVKPSNLGSSIGITKAKNKNQLKFAIDVAFNFDSRVIIEKCIENAVEINVATLGFEDVMLSVLEKPASFCDFLSFEEKYTNGDIQNKKVLNPKLDESVKNEIESLAKKCFDVFSLSGVCRIDFLLDKNKVYVNEINTIPGSLAFYLFKDKDIEFFELIDKLIEFAKQKKNAGKLNSYAFNSNVIQSYKDNNINKYNK